MASNEELLAELERLIERDIRQEDREIKAVIASLVSFLQKSIIEMMKDFPPVANIKSRAVLSFLGGLDSKLDDEGLPEQIARIKDLFDLQYEMAQEQWKTANEKKKAPSLSQQNLVKFDVFVFGRQQSVRGIIDSYVGEVRESVIDAVVTGGRPDAVAAVDRVSSRLNRDLLVDLETGLAGFNRLVQVEQAEKAGNRFVLYAGPKDYRNRPFCADRAMLIFELADVYKWDNGQGLPVIPYCGGYGCRHRLLPVANDFGRTRAVKLDRPSATGASRKKRKKGA